MVGLAKAEDLRALRAWLARKAEERAAWDGLMEAHHYLGFGVRCCGMCGIAGRELGDAGWLILGALRAGARDRWTG